MDVKGKKFGRGPKEIAGGADLINKCKLWPHHEFFCKRSIPSTISGTSYLRNVVGDTEIRKGNGMQLGQLFQNASDLKESARFRPFDLDVLNNAFYMREAVPVELPSAEKGVPTAERPKNASAVKERKHKRHRDNDKKDKDHKKHKHKHRRKHKKVKI